MQHTTLKKKNLRMVIHFILTNSKFLKVELEGLIESSASVKTTPRMDVAGDGSKVRCCKEQYFIVTWNVRSMN